MNLHEWYANQLIELLEMRNEEAHFDWTQSSWNNNKTIVSRHVFLCKLHINTRLQLRPKKQGRQFQEQQFQIENPSLASDSKKQNYMHSKNNKDQKLC